MISRKFILVFTTSTFLSLSSAVFSQEGSAIIIGNAPIVKARVVALSSAVFTRAPVTEQNLNEHGCRYETEVPEKLDELKSIISVNVHSTSSNTFTPTNLRTAVYLYTADGLTHRYLFNAESAKEQIYGSFNLESKSFPINTDSRLIVRLKKWAGPDTPWQKFSDTCL